jgi:hypothetical protein
LISNDQSVRAVANKPASLGARLAASPQWLDVLLVATVAFSVRLLHATFLAKTPFFEGLTVDSATYWGLAQHAASTGDFGGAFYQPPLYPAFLALLFKLGVTTVWGVAIVQLVLGSVTAGLMVLVGRRLASATHNPRLVGLVVGLATAAYGPFVLFDAELLPPVVVNLLLVTALLLALRPGRVGLADAAIGLLGGTAITGWPLSFALIPGLLALRARRVARPSQRALGMALALALSVPPIAITAAHNASRDGAGVLVSYNTGINLWLGNAPNWQDTWRARPGAEFEPESERPDRAGVTKPAEKTAYFVRLVGRQIVERPLAALSRTVEKFYYVWHGREIRRNQDIALLREASPPLRALVWEAGLCFPFGLLAPLAFLALFRRRSEVDVPIIAVTLVLYAAAVAVFFVAERYRLPLVLLMLPLAVDEVFSYFIGATGHRLALLGVTTIALNLPMSLTKTFVASEAERGVITTRALMFRREMPLADGLSDSLARRFPRDANVQMVRAEVLAMTKGCDLAIPYLEATVKLAPSTTTPRVMLGGCYGARGDESATVRVFTELLKVHPYHRDALRVVGLSHARHGRVTEARQLLRRFVATGYRDPFVGRWLKTFGAR